MEEESGVESSMTEDDMKDYVEIVMNELKEKRQYSLSINVKMTKFSTVRNRICITLEKG